MLRIFAIGLNTNQVSIGRATPVIGTAGMEESPRQSTKGQDEFVGIVALERNAGELK